MVFIRTKKKNEMKTNLYFQKKIQNTTLYKLNSIQLITVKYLLPYMVMVY